MVHEVFADRAYEDDGSLVSRRKPGAVLHDAKEIAGRVVRMVQDGAVVSVTGNVIKMRTDTVCIHGDTPGAVDIARDLRGALKQAGIEVAPIQEGELKRFRAKWIPVRVKKTRQQESSALDQNG